LGVALIVEKMMAKVVERRFQTPLEAAHALAPWTQAAIPPPAEAELPSLSPAALGAGLPPPPPSPVPDGPKVLPGMYVAPRAPFPSPAPFPPAPAKVAVAAPPKRAAKALPLYTPLHSKRRPPLLPGVVVTALVVAVGVLIGCAAGFWINYLR
jgi:hypothetical protein